MMTGEVTEKKIRNVADAMPRRLRGKMWCCYYEHSRNATEKISNSEAAKGEGIENKFLILSVNCPP
jgi:hypothetical protein